MTCPEISNNEFRDDAMHSSNCSMYNALMPADSFEIRVCDACGLRYPLVDVHAETFGMRCPACLGETRVALSRKLVTEPGRDRPGSLQRAGPKGARHASEERRKEERGQLAVLLDSIRSAWNVGSILRSADGFGFAQAYLCGITPTPASEAVRKTSLGAEESVPWSYHKDAVELVKNLKSQGWQVLALEENERATSLIRSTSAWRRVSIHPSSPLRYAQDYSTTGRHSARREVLVVGNEVTGVDPGLIELCDRIYSIPMRGQKRSFNVAIAFGIAAYALMER